MTPATVQRRLDEIRAAAGDYEVAHSLEDEMRTEVLRSIAERTCDDPREMARLALQSADIDFVRYTA